MAFKSLDGFSKRKLTGMKYISICKACVVRNTIARTKERTGRGICKACDNARVTSAYCKYHQDIFNDASKVRRANTLRRLYLAYGSRCVCCGETNPLFLSLDHVSNDGAKQRKQLFGDRTKGGERFYKWVIANGFPKSIQILCMNCNMGKYRNKGTCPHVVNITEQAIQNNASLRTI